jgi:peptidoglycan hydrolase-like protein with peptidoglycan-binding domain
MLRTIAEDQPGYIPLRPDGIYGPETRHAVMTFQRNQGLPPTGVTDQVTCERIVEEYEIALLSRGEAWPIYPLLDPGQILRRGERHPHVFLLQAILAVLSEAYPGLTAPSHSGILDDLTIQALEGFQILSGLPPTGQLDKRTWKHLALQYPLAAAGG